MREWRKSSLMIYGIVLFFQVWIIINILYPAIDWLQIKITIFLFWGLTSIELYNVQPLTLYTFLIWPRAGNLYSWPIQRGSTQRGYLFQAWDRWTSTNFQGQSRWQGREICKCVFNCYRIKDLLKWSVDKVKQSIILWDALEF